MIVDTLTVVYRDEIELLHKQAGRLNRYTPMHSENYMPIVNNIFVIVNDDELTTDYINPDWWRVEKDKVSVMHRSEFGYYPPPIMKGWYTQQVCKILGTCHAESEWCLIFDAKTMLNKDYNVDLLFDGNRARCANWAENMSPHWQTGVQFLKDKFGITDFKWISPAGVPFLAHVPTMRAMVYEEPDFVEWFHTYCDFPSKFNQTTRGITEFLCYSAYVSSIPGLFEELYTGEQAIKVYNLADWEADKFDNWMAEVKRITPFTVSIHPRAYNLLNHKQKAEWDEYIK